MKTCMIVVTATTIVLLLVSCSSLTGTQGVPSTVSAAEVKQNTTDFPPAFQEDASYECIGTLHVSFRVTKVLESGWLEITDAPQGYTMLDTEHLILCNEVSQPSQ